MYVIGCWLLICKYLKIIIFISIMNWNKNTYYKKLPIKWLWFPSHTNYRSILYYHFIISESAKKNLKDILWEPVDLKDKPHGSTAIQHYRFG